MYTKLLFENYKIFKTMQELEIRPITILFGKNNAGKSAVLKLPLLMANALKGASDEVMLPDFNGVELFADLRDLVYGRATRAITLGVEDEKNNSKLKFSFYVDVEKEVKSHVEKWSLETPEIERNIDTDTLDVSFRGAIPQNIMEEECAEIRKLGAFVDYIGNIRVKDQIRDMRMASTLAECSGREGEKGYSHLIKDSQTASHVLLNKVSDWYSQTFSGWGIEVDGTSVPVFHINVTNGMVQTNIADAGFGIVQSLPIVIRACRPCMRETMIILEEPEAHLHPAAQGNLGELIARSAKEDANKRYLIETHSFNFILRVRALVAAGVLSPKDVAIYFVDYNKNDKGSNLRKVGLDEKGKVSNWPKGVFEETYDEIVRILNAQNQQS